MGSTAWQPPPSLFQRRESAGACDLWKAICIDHEIQNVVRLQLEALWRHYRPYATEHFYHEFPRDTQARFWEMYLAVALLRRGVTLKRLPDDSPDIGFLAASGTSVWIEAAAPGPGQAGLPDSVDDFPFHPDAPVEALCVPELPILLRLMHAIYEKRKQRCRQLRSGVIQRHQPFVIAVNAGGIPAARFPTSLPWIVKSLFPIGDLTATFDCTTSAFVGAGWSTRVAVPKANGREISTTLFTQPRSRGVSAVLYSAVHPGSLLRDEALECGLDFVLVHNPYAAFPLPDDVLPDAEHWIARPDGDGFLTLTRRQRQH
ncbi:hypothetical protein [Sediminicoccus sp. KRV36]|uniref:hypothetical protein n=1 Tax=Sediminicoccus sp. KRV36 TaxID=3133721 RepID=UPI00200D380F|nr:hypothetical protein [Sediminicoccus rosea]UPY36137.1 hypothetical protein LHU95_18245 [Sediminicoccus rosea]